MPRKYIKKTTRGEIPYEIVLDAVKRVCKDGVTIRKAAADSNINYRTLARYCRNVDRNEPVDLTLIYGYKKPRQVFTDAEETRLYLCLKEAADIYQDLVPKEVRKLAYEYGKKLGKTMPPRWCEEGYAGPDWFTAFRKRHPDLIVRCPEKNNTTVREIKQMNTDLCFTDNMKNVCMLGDMGEVDFAIVQKQAHNTGADNTEQISSDRVN